MVVSIVAIRTAGESEDDDDPDADAFDDGFDPAIRPAPDAGAGVPRLIRSLASGFVIGADGYILTSAHAVSTNGEATVRLADNRQFSARVVGLDKLSDVALLKIDAVGLPVATVGDPSDLAVGEWVAAIDLGESSDKHFGLQLGELGSAERRALKVESGIRVIDVRGAALRAGIRPRDLILAVNEFPVSSVAEFEALLAGIPVGRSPALLVRRSGALSYIAVTSHPH